MEGGQSGTYIRLTRASSGPRVSIANARFLDSGDICQVAIDLLQLSIR